MQYEDFKEAFTAEMNYLLEGSGVRISSQQVSKVNETLDALSFQREGDNVGTLLYLNEIYEQHEKGAGISELAAEARDFMGYRMSRIPEFPEIDHDFISSNLYLTVMNADMNRDYLTEIPHEMLEDMAVVPRVKVSEDASFAVKEDMLEAYGFTKEDLLKTAHANMDRQEFTCQDLGTVLFGFGVTPFPDDPSPGIFVLTNPSGIDGAAAILSEKAMKDARAQIGEDFFILPSSRHEVLLIPRSMDMSVNQLTDMVREVNRTAVEAKDLLSDHVYRYNSNTGTIKMLEAKSESLEKKQSLPPILM